jgi:hypothetical protein
MFSPTEPLRDLLESVILEPLAFVASVPKLLATGRAKIESQTKTANMIGKFVVPMAKRKIDAELKTVAESVRSYLTNTESKAAPKAKATTKPDDATKSAASPTPVPKPAAKKAIRPKPAPSKQSAAKQSAAEVIAPKAVVPKASGPKVLVTKVTGSKTSDSKTSDSKASDSKTSDSKTSDSKTSDSKASAAKVPKAKAAARAVALLPTVNDLGLDSYDDLPASSVVGLLEALTPAELRAIAGYEASHRNRQTILGGVARLLDAAQ